MLVSSLNGKFPLMWKEELQRCFQNHALSYHSYGYLFSFIVIACAGGNLHKPCICSEWASVGHNSVDGTLARKKALSQATADAFAIIKRRLLLPGQPAADQLDELAFADFIDFIHIESETALSQRYIAKIGICFDPVRMRDQFIKLGLLWSELFSSPVLLLPVWQDPSGTRVWTRNVAWLDVWRQMDAQDDQLLGLLFSRLTWRSNVVCLLNASAIMIPVYWPYLQQQQGRSKLRFYLLVWNIQVTCQS